MTEYVNQTGEGYLGVSVVSTPRTVSFGTGNWPDEWQGRDIYAVVEAPGVALCPMGREPENAIGRYRTSKGSYLTISGAVLRVLGVGVGDDVRVYERDGGGVLLVGADPDPFLEDDDGR